MQCANCRSDLKEGAGFCGNCGAQVILPPNQPAEPWVPPPPAPAVPSPLPEPQAPQQPHSPQQPASQLPATPYTAPGAPTAQYAGPPPTYAIPKQPSHGLSIASLVLGILSLVTCIIWFFAIPLGVAALICGFIGRPRGGKGMATAGIITAIAGIILTIVITAFAVKYLDDHPEESKQYNNIPTSKTIALVKSYSLSSADFR